ncbi:sensor histidine kinase [Cohnella luojiensis]|uniref:histidine kinase n=1 Tax=Cohnella luojiensis TaxID=652876 RepID=A0A4Y8M3H5_9BACL|nr:HAMP domain-containing sensor histidine kinase [Cohnella luojiensis]TFE28590.1 HAMP domain-containing histidine kinase [Cohnella luojiensis]
MLFVWIALWAIALILLLADPRSPVNRRLGAVALSGGAGAMAATLADVFIPYIHSEHPNAGLEDALYTVQAGASLTSYYGLPYGYLLFAMAYHPINLSRKVLRIASLVLTTPIILCVIFTPPYNEYEPISHSIVVWWAVPYFLLATALVLSKRSSHHSLPHTHWLICLAVLPPVLFTMMMSYILPSFGILRMWKYNVWFVALGVAVFLIGLFTYGFLGVRVLIDRRRLDSTLRAVTSGTAILHHAIKNDVGKMRLFTEKMKVYAERTDQRELLEDIRVLQDASRHIQDMISRVHRRTEDLVVQPREVDVKTLVRSTLKPYEPLLGKIKLHVTIPEGWQCFLDPAQVGEALNNLISNAVDAMNGEGHLFITLREGKRELTLEVRDTGPGMDKAQAAKALEPFYTTKSGKEANFGLGLPYAYYVMRKHGGSLHIRSKKGIGTRVYLIFPKRSVKAVKMQQDVSVAEGKEAHG